MGNGVEQCAAMLAALWCRHSNHTTENKHGVRVS